MIEATVKLPTPRRDSPGVLAVGRLRELGQRLGVDVGDRSAVLDLAAVGAVKVAWRDSPVEDWHADSENRIWDSDMMRANVAMTRLVRELLHTHAAAAGGLLPSDSRWPGSEPVEMFGEICTVISDPHRLLPDGRSLAELAPDQGELDLFVEHVRACGRGWTGLARFHSVEAVVLALAVLGVQRCRHWWLAPGWPEVVEEFMRCLKCPDRWYHPVITAAAAGVARPVELADDDELRRRLEAGPDLLSAEHAAYCVQAGLNAAFRIHVGALDRSEWTRLAEVLEPTVRHRQLRRSCGSGRS